MNLWQTVSMWLTINYTNVIGCGIVVGWTVAVWFLTWLICRTSWKRTLESRLPEITRTKIKDRDETIFHLRRDNARLTEQVETLSVKERAALRMLYQSAELLQTPAIASEIEIRRKAK